MVNDFIAGLGYGLVALVILALSAMVGYGLGDIIGAEDPQVTAIGFVASCVIVGIANVIRRR